MNVEVLKSKGEELTLRLKNVGFEYSNALRRACMNHVPVMAIEDVTFSKNNSALYDEVLALHLGLVPLKTDLKSYVPRAECKCKGEGCARCTVTFKLSKKGPCTVYSGDMVSSDPSIKPVYDNKILVKLFQNQEVEFEAVAELGTGSVHSKWSPCLAYYKFTPKIGINNHLVKDAKLVVDSCHMHVFKEKSKTAVEVDDKKLFDCDLCLNCTEVSEGVKIESDDKDILFTIESWGQLAPKHIYEKALEVLNEEFELLDKELK